MGLVKYVYVIPSKCNRKGRKVIDQTRILMMRRKNAKIVRGRAVIKMSDKLSACSQSFPLVQRHLCSCFGKNDATTVSVYSLSQILNLPAARILLSMLTRST